VKKENKGAEINSHPIFGRLLGSGCSNHKQNEASFGHLSSS